MRRKTYTVDRANLNPYLRKLNSILTAKSLTPTSLSIMAGLGSSTISNLLKRNNVPTIPTLEKICAVLSMRLSIFFSEIEEENPGMYDIARKGVQRYDPMSRRKKQIIDEWAALPVNDQAETLKLMMETYEEYEKK